MTQKSSLKRPGNFWSRTLLILMVARLVGCFNRDGLISFYVFFESRALVVFFFVLRFGYQPERHVARLYLILFTALTSLPFILLVLVLVKSFSFMTFRALQSAWRFYRTPLSRSLRALLVLGFLVKFPVYVFHIWLPKAHVEASRSGSILLAGILLKLGTYGAYIVRGLLYGRFIGYYSVFFALLGGLILRGLSLRLVDFKVLIAYSSVVHIRFVMGGVLSINRLGEVGSLGISLSHGVVSSGLFFGAGVYYNSSNSRLFMFNKGSITTAPWFSFFWFILCASNMGTPPSFNF